MRCAIGFFAAVLVLHVLAATGARAAPPGADEGSREAKPQRVLYFRWHGTRPGDRITGSYLAAFELDLAGGRLRQIHRQAGAPEPTLPHEPQKVERLLAGVPWCRLSAATTDAFRSFTRAWLAAGPPEAYEVYVNLGTEDGYAERLSVFFKEGLLATDVRAVSGMPPQGLNSPPRQWQFLVAAAMAPLGAAPPDHGAEKQGGADGPHHVFYYRWHGMSPGAGFTRTVLFALELDLVGGRLRSAEADPGPSEPMPGGQPEDARALLARQPWTPLADDEVGGFRALVEAWLATEPPETYGRFRGLGREDGYREELVVRLEGKQVRTAINPRPREPYVPPPAEWHRLVGAASSVQSLMLRPIGSIP